MFRAKIGVFAVILLSLVVVACSPAEGLPGTGTGVNETLPAVTEEGLPETGIEGATQAAPLPGATEEGLPGTGAEATEAAPLPEEGSVDDVVPQEVVDEVQRRIGESLELPVEQLAVVSAEKVNWRDSCLELGGPEESCAQVITPGWRIILRADGQEYEVRTDELGTQVRWTPRAPSQ